MKSNLNTRIKQYASTAAAIIGVSSVSNANVIYTDINDVLLDTTGGEFYDVDINNDATMDFRIYHNAAKGIQSYFGSWGPYSYGSCVSSGWWASYQNRTYGNVNMYAFTYGNGAVRGSSYYASVMNTTQSVGVANNFGNWMNLGRNNVNSVGMWSSFSKNCGSSNSYQGSWGPYTSSAGPWVGNISGYLGVRFNIAGNIHYGWIRLTTTGAMINVKIQDYAYEACAGVNIAVGDSMGTLSFHSINQVMNGCDSIQFNGMSFFTDTTVIDTLTGALCDSIRTTDITINSSKRTDTTATIMEGDSIMLGGNFQTVSGTYNDTVTTNKGCDSIIATQLTVTPDNSTSIIEAKFVDIKVSPNPSAGIYNLDLTALRSEMVDFIIIDNLGKVIKSESKANKATLHTIDISDVEDGIYFLLIKNENIHTTIKLIKN